MSYRLQCLCFVLLCVTSPAHSQTWIENEIKNNLQTEFSTNCDSLVSVIRKDTRDKYTSISTPTIEQIYERKTLDSDETSVSCRGMALFSNSEKKLIEYGAKQDIHGQWIVQYNRGY